MVEYKFKIGDRVRRIIKNNEYIKIGDTGVINYIDASNIRLNEFINLHSPEFFELVKPKEEIINNYELY